MKDVWSDTDNEEAMRRGWLIADAESSEANKSGKRRYQLQKFDDAHLFESDDDVWLSVLPRAFAQPRGLEGRAMEFLSAESPEEFFAIVHFNWQRKSAA